MHSGGTRESPISIDDLPLQDSQVRREEESVTDCRGDIVGITSGGV
jgi:hypothetical protein